MRRAFAILARCKGLRGTALDPFGRTEERRTERALITEYGADLDRLCQGLDAGRHALAVDLARLPEQIKGFGHVKERHLVAARQRRSELLARWDAGPAADPAPQARAA